ncbi:BTAD domain-containing putative transcriptional regulator [Streptomyces olivaceoviridis]
MDVNGEKGDRMVVEFSLLGTIEARLDGRPADVGHMRQRCVLAALLLDVNKAVSVDALVDRVWGDRPPQRVRGTLYGYLSRLRQALAQAPEVIMLALYRAGGAADALSCYEDIRRRLAHELGADPGPPLRGLHQQILANDPALALHETATERLSAGAATTSPVPRQLLAPPAHFVGRDAELAVLDKMLASQAEPRTTMPLAVICGTGGVGKTWLALRWAHSRNVGKLAQSNCSAYDPKPT